MTVSKSFINRHVQGSASSKSTTPTSLRLAFAIHCRTPNSQTTKIPQQAELKGLICGEYYSARKYLWVGNNKMNCALKPVITVCMEVVGEKLEVGRHVRTWMFVACFRTAVSCLWSCLLSSWLCGRRIGSGCSWCQLLDLTIGRVLDVKMCHTPLASFQMPLCTCPIAKLGT